MPRRSSTHRARASRMTFLAGLVAITGWATAAGAAPTLGFIEHWSGTSLSTWGGGSTYANPGTGGVGGIGDGFLTVSTSIAGNLGTKSSGAEYTGNWVTAGITQVRVWLNDVGATQPLEIHFGIGRDMLDASPNFWQYNVGMIPPAQSWGQYVIDLTSANFTRIQGTGTLADALQNAKTILLRHDVAPYIGTPDAMLGDFGVDHLLLTNGLVGVEPGSRVAVARPVQLAPPVPNPSRGEVMLALDTFGPGPVHVQILDASGRVVRHTELTSAVAGRTVWTWDGANDAGRRVAPGYYRARAWGDSGGTSRALLRTE